MVSRKPRRPHARRFGRAASIATASVHTRARTSFIPAPCPLVSAAAEKGEGSSGSASG